MKYILLFLPLLLTGCSSKDTSDPVLESKIQEVEQQIEAAEDVLDILKEEIPTTDVTLYFGDLETIIASDCSATITTTRSLATENPTPDQVLEVLLEGVTIEEEEQGLSDSFTNEDGFMGEVEGLKEYFQGVSVFDGVAVVDFAPPAMAYLNSAACLQASVKWPIIRTLQEFPDIEEVEFSIDGDLVTEWDA